VSKRAELPSQSHVHFTADTHWVRLIVRLECDIVVSKFPSIEAMVQARSSRSASDEANITSTKCGIAFPRSRGLHYSSVPRQESNAVVPLAGIRAGGGSTLNCQDPSRPRWVDQSTRCGHARIWSVIGTWRSGLCQHRATQPATSIVPESFHRRKPVQRNRRRYL